MPSPVEIPGWADEVVANPLRGSEQAKSPTSQPSLTSRRWLPFQFSLLFDLKKGRRLTKANMTNGKTPYIGAVEKTNGRTDYIGQAPIHDGNTITVNYDGSIAEAFYQPVPFWCSDAVNVLYPKFTLTPAIAMFIITVIRNEKYRFHYGRKWHLERMSRSEIHLPVQRDGTPDWKYMESYIDTLPFSSRL